MGEMNDKLKHIAILLALGITTILSKTLLLRIVIIFIAIAVSIGKEIYDMKKKKATGFSLPDLGADLLGFCMGLALGL